MLLDRNRVEFFRKKELCIGDIPHHKARRKMRLASGPNEIIDRRKVSCHQVLFDQLIGHPLAWRQFPTHFFKGKRISSSPLYARKKFRKYDHILWLIRYIGRAPFSAVPEIVLPSDRYIGSGPDQHEFLRSRQVWKNTFHRYPEEPGSRQAAAW
jgi:hypothetical protein